MTEPALPKRPRIGLFVTCLVDLIRPVVGFAAVHLLEQAGAEVLVPAQTCCGQPAWNSGDRETAGALARQMIQAFEGFDQIVVPSGSCAGMIHKHYVELLREDPAWAPRARKVGMRTFELTQWLSHHAPRPLQDLPALPSAQSATYHDSCSSLREMQVKAEPRALLAKVGNLDLREMAGTEECCGFGGTFCVKYPAISDRMASAKLAHAAETKADLLLAGDLGCLMNLAGKLARQGSPMQVRHIAEVLAGMTAAEPPLAAGS